MGRIGGGHIRIHEVLLWQEGICHRQPGSSGILYYHSNEHGPIGGPPRVLIFGGSQGAHAINMAMVAAAPRLAAAGGVEVTHQTGERDLDVVRRAYRDAGLEARVEPFLFAIDREMKRRRP